MEQLLCNLAGKVREERLNGKRYLVAPLSLIVPGVLNGSQGALYYPEDEVAKHATIWNNIPLVVYHPTDNSGNPLSANDPDVLHRSGIGFATKSTFNGKQTAEGWFDIEAMKRIHNGVYENLKHNRPIELSTGLYTDNELAPDGSNYKGAPYTHIARNYRPDHIAILPDQVGACSINAGCGVLVNANPEGHNQYTGQGGISSGDVKKRAKQAEAKFMYHAEREGEYRRAIKAGDTSDQVKKLHEHHGEMSTHYMNAADSYGRGSKQGGEKHERLATDQASKFWEGGPAGNQASDIEAVINALDAKEYSVIGNSASDHLDITAEKACKIIKDGTAQGHPLTAAQRGMFGAKCGERTNNAEASVEGLFSTLLHASSDAHILHLQTRSFAAHMALDALYKELPGLVDSLIEAYQGKHGVVKDYGTPAELSNDPVEFVTELSALVESHRKTVGDDTELQNIVDEIAGLLDSTRYKLTTLNSKALGFGPNVWKGIDLSNLPPNIKSAVLEVTESKMPYQRMRQAVKDIVTEYTANVWTDAARQAAIEARHAAGDVNAERMGAQKTKEALAFHKAGFAQAKANHEKFKADSESHYAAGRNEEGGAAAAKALGALRAMRFHRDEYESRKGIKPVGNGGPGSGPHPSVIQEHYGLDVSHLPKSAMQTVGAIHDSNLPHDRKLHGINSILAKFPKSGAVAANAKDAKGHGSNKHITEGNTVRFEGKSADNSIEGGMDVKVINPHSNAHEVAFTKGGRDYDKRGFSHIPTATVERPAQKFMGQMRPAKQFEAHHFTLHPITTHNAWNNAAWQASAEARQASHDSVGGRVRLPLPKKAFDLSQKGNHIGAAKAHENAAVHHGQLSELMGGDKLHEAARDAHLKAADAHMKAHVEKQMGPLKVPAMNKKTIWNKLGELLGLTDNAAMSSEATDQDDKNRGFDVTGESPDDDKTPEERAHEAYMKALLGGFQPDRDSMLSPIGQGGAISPSSTRNDAATRTPTATEDDIDTTHDETQADDVNDDDSPNPNDWEHADPESKMTPNDHERKATYHEVAAEDHAAKGRDGLADYHKGQADHHRSKAAQKMSGISSTESPGVSGVVQNGGPGSGPRPGETKIYSGEHGFHRDYHDARGHAQASADKHGLDVALKAGKEFGKKGYHVHFASKNDSDYSTAEIVRPGEPKSIHNSEADAVTKALEMVTNSEKDSVILTTYNRNWPKSKRDKTPAEDFAGPDESFPIADQTDVDAAAHLVGKASDPEAVKSRIKGIAKKKGLSLPEAWKSKATENVEIVDNLDMSSLKEGDRWERISDGATGVKYKITRQVTSNSLGDATMATKKEVIDKLVANCGCQENNVWKEEDRPILNAMSDDRLLAMLKQRQSLADNAMVVNTVRKKFKLSDKLTLNESAAVIGKLKVKGKPGNTAPANGNDNLSDDDDRDSYTGNDEDEEGSENDNDADDKMSANAEREYLANAPPSIREMFSESKKIINNERDKIIKTLVTNVQGDEQKKVTANYLGKKSLDELRILNNLTPAAPREADKVRAMPMFYGSQGTAPTTNAGGQQDNPEENLDMAPPTINYREWAKEDRESRAS